MTATPAQERLVSSCNLSRLRAGIPISDLALGMGADPAHVEAVLYGTRGATIDECADLLVTLSLLLKFGEDEHLG